MLQMQEHLSKHGGWNFEVSRTGDFITLYPLLRDYVQSTGVWEAEICPTPMCWVFPYDKKGDRFKSPIIKNLKSVEEDLRPHANLILKNRLSEIQKMIFLFCKG
jgi:hypothetical protein